MLALSKKASFVSCIVAGSAAYAKLMPEELSLAFENKDNLAFDIPNSISEESPLGKLLVVVSDNITSHNNIVHDGGIPYKGYVLNALGIYCFDILNENNIPNPLICYGKEIFKHLPFSREVLPGDLHLRAMVIKKSNTETVNLPFVETLKIIEGLTSKVFCMDISSVSGEIEQVTKLVEEKWRMSGTNNLPIEFPPEVASDIANSHYRDKFFFITGLSLEDYLRKNGFWS